MKGAVRASSRSAPRIRVGISGWRYAPWRGVFYPAGLPQRRELAYAASRFDTLEINGSFYSLQHPRCWMRWYADTPDSFVFSVKGPRFVTHMLKLRNAEQPLANFFASGVLALKEKLGPILWQLPPAVRFEPERIESFLRLLPRDTESALRLARRRHARMHGRSRLAIDAPRPLRHAFEIRHESFLDPRFTALLRAHGIALVVAETARRWPMPYDVTADFVYLRLHGDREIYRSGYGPVALARWAARIEAWCAGGEPDDLPHGAVRIDARPPEKLPRDVYCYFDNTDVKLRAPFDARRLARMLAATPSAPSRARAIAAPARPRTGPGSGTTRRSPRRRTTAY